MLHQKQFQYYIIAIQRKDRPLRKTIVEFTSNDFPCRLFFKLQHLVCEKNFRRKYWDVQPKCLAIVMLQKRHISSNLELFAIQEIQEVFKRTPDFIKIQTDKKSFDISELSQKRFISAIVHRFSTTYVSAETHLQSIEMHITAF